ncbi:MAG: hypothetical protein WCL25_01245 [bacterium]
MTSLESRKEKLNWDFYSAALILVYAMLQLLRWRILPQFMDIYYHILTAWGFIQAGGFTGWDFWQYAPVGRVHIYPPLLHILLALLMKCGASAIILAKLFETFTPVLFLFTLWVFLRRNYNAKLAFFGVVVLGSSFSFYLSLINHIPATLAAIFGLLAADQFFRKRLIRAVILLTACFYTHIGMPWFFSLAILFYGFMDRERRRDSLFLLLSSIILSAPMLFKELNGLKHISALGFNLQEKHAIQFKIAEYLLVAFGLFLAIKKGGSYKFFLAFFLASFIFLLYPYRFFCAEGYFAIILLGSLTLAEFFNLLTDRMKWPGYMVFLMLILFEIFSPTLARDTINEGAGAGYRFKAFDSAFAGMLFAKGDSIWSPGDYVLASEIIKKNSNTRDIIYSTLNPIGMGLAAVSGRATANALLVEIGPAQEFDPFAVSKIIIFPVDEERGLLEAKVRKYSLEKIGETKALILYRSLNRRLAVKINKASVPFVFIAILVLAAAIILIKNRRKIYLT